MNGLRHAEFEVQTLPIVEPNENAQFMAVAPEKCPQCGGTLKDYNAESAVIPPGVSLTPVSTFIVHLFICEWCRKKVFAPPRKD